jgi:F-type H+-transporting ATPase subunit epsilon
MAAMEVQLVSPERILYTGEATFVLARTIGGGDIAFLPGHAPFIGALAVHPVVIRPESGAEVTVAAHGGFVEVSNNRVTILSDIAELPDQIDVGRAEAARDRANEALRANADDDDARAALARSVVRLAVAMGTPASAAAGSH